MHEEWQLNDKYFKTRLKEDREAADAKMEEERMIRDAYAEKVYDYFVQNDQVFVNKNTGKMTMFNKALDISDPGNMNNDQKNALIAYQNDPTGGNGLYRLFDSDKDDISKAEKVRWREYVKWERDNNP